MNEGRQKELLSLPVRRILRRYKPDLARHLRSRLEEWTKEHGGPPDAIEEIQNCLAAACDDLDLELQSQEELPEPDPEIVARSFADFENGNWRSPEEILNELQGSHF